MERNYEAIASVYRNVAALEAIAKLLTETADDLEPVSVMGFGHICKLLHDDLEKAAEKLSS